jgi:phage-related protein
MLQRRALSYNNIDIIGDLCMPQTTVVFYQDEDRGVPVLEWLRVLHRRDRRAYAKCIARIQRLAEMGHELRRPEADYLRDEIYELRARRGRVQYRMLYFFHGQNLAVLAHALTKEGQVPAADIERAIRRKAAFERNPEGHSYEEELRDG